MIWNNHKLTKSIYLAGEFVCPGDSQTRFYIAKVDNGPTVVTIKQWTNSGAFPQTVVLNSSAIQEFMAWLTQEVNNAT